MNVIALCVAAMKADRKRLKVEKADLVSQMQQLYATLESREEQLREFIRNYDQHRKVPFVLPNTVEEVKVHMFLYVRQEKVCCLITNCPFFSN